MNRNWMGVSSWMGLSSDQVAAIDLWFTEGPLEQKALALETLRSLAPVEVMLHWSGVPLEVTPLRDGSWTVFRGAPEAFAAGHSWSTSLQVAAAYAEFVWNGGNAPRLWPGGFRPNGDRASVWSSTVDRDEIAIVIRQAAPKVLGGYLFEEVVVFDPAVLAPVAVPESRFAHLRRWEVA